MYNYYTHLKDIQNVHTCTSWQILDRLLLVSECMCVKLPKDTESRAVSFRTQMSHNKMSLPPNSSATQCSTCTVSKHPYIFFFFSLSLCHKVICTVMIHVHPISIISLFTSVLFYLLVHPDNTITSILVTTDWTLTQNTSQYSLQPTNATENAWNKTISKGE